MEVIKTQAKEGNAKIQSLHYQINDILYKYSWRYIAPATANRLYSELGQLGKQLSEIDVTDRVKAKQEEILDNLRSILVALRSYAKTYTWIADDERQVTASLRCYLSRYLKDRDNLDVVDCLKDNKQLWEEMYLQCPYRTNVKTEKYIAMQNELLDKIRQLYAIN